MRFICTVIAALIVTVSTAHAQPFAPKSMAYVLQADSFQKTKAKAVAALAASGRDVVVIDYSYTGDAADKWSPADVAAIRAGKPGRKVVAYMSIGEAEDYRFYWQNKWDANHDGKPDPGAPAWLDAANPDWPGNYKVRYWQAAWQTIIFGYLDQVLAQGFDGVYLDIVDGFEYYEYNPATKQWIYNRINPETKQTFRRDMADFVLRLAARARRVRPGFLVIPQNGSQLLRFPDFTAGVSAIGIEDLFTDGNAKQTASHYKPILSDLSFIKSAGKTVLLIEYGTTATARQTSIAGAQTNGLILLLTDRNLKTLGTVP
jgi:cysteinyl-tRNA synthetase